MSILIVRKVCSSLLLVLFIAHSGFSKGIIDSITIAPFGLVHLYIPDKSPETVSIMISGDGGWKYGVLDFSKHFANKNSLVIGVDILSYYKNLKSRKEACCHITSDFVNLTTTIEKKYKLTKFQDPILMGYSSGATLVYALLAQARPNTFHGGISLGFCPDVELPKHFCELNGLKLQAVDAKSFNLMPDSQLGNQWIVMQGKLDNICSFQKTEEFTKKCSNAELIALDKVGHGFSKWIDFMPQWDKAFEKLSNTNSKSSMLEVKPLRSESISDLPYTFTKANIKIETAPLVLFISGDGGWYSFEQNLSDRLAMQGVATIGLDAKKYFWNRKSPQQSAHDITRLLTHFADSLQKNNFLLIGYSMGAEVLPFIYEQLSSEVKAKTKQLVLLSPDVYADFEIHLTNMLGIGSNENTYNVVEQLNKINSAISIHIVTGEDENSSLSKDLAKTSIQFAKVPGNHHYNNNSEVIFNLLKANKLI